MLKSIATAAAALACGIVSIKIAGRCGEVAGENLAKSIHQANRRARLAKEAHDRAHQEAESLHQQAAMNHLMVHNNHQGF